MGDQSLAAVRIDNWLHFTVPSLHRKKRSKSRQQMPRTQSCNEPSTATPETEFRAQPTGRFERKSRLTARHFALRSPKSELISPCFSAIVPLLSFLLTVSQFLECLQLRQTCCNCIANALANRLQKAWHLVKPDCLFWPDTIPWLDRYLV